MELETQLRIHPVTMSQSSRMSERNNVNKVVRGGNTLQRLLAVSFGLVCIIQATLNVSLRLFVRGGIKGETTDVCTRCLNHTDILKLSRFDDYFQQGWVYLYPSLYYISTDKKTWRESREYCVQRQSDLLILNNDLEQDFFEKFERTIWIGLTDTEKEGTWKWVDGTTPSKSFWDKGEPNSYEGQDEDCAEKRAYRRPNSWNDATCQNRNFWVCEKKLTPDFWQSRD